MTTVGSCNRLSPFFAQNTATIMESISSKFKKVEDSIMKKAMAFCAVFIGIIIGALGVRAADFGMQTYYEKTDKTNPIYEVVKDYGWTIYINGERVY